MTSQPPPAHHSQSWGQNPLGPHFEIVLKCAGNATGRILSPGEAHEVGRLDQGLLWEVKALGMRDEVILREWHHGVQAEAEKSPSWSKVSPVWDDGSHSN